MATSGIAGDDSRRRASCSLSGQLEGEARPSLELPGGLDSRGRSTDHRLLVAVDIGDHHVVVDRVDCTLDLLDRCEDCRHLPCVGHVDVGHLAPAPGNGFERILERERTGRHQGPVLAQAVAHHHVGLHPECGEHLGECSVDRQDGRLRDLRLPEFGVSGDHG